MLYLMGKIANVTSGFSAEAERLLTQSLKLDASQMDAWNQLGVCNWKKRDLRSAAEAFEASQRCCPNAEALRSLSQLARAVAQQSNSSDLSAACVQSIAKAKACIALCVSRTSAEPGDVESAWAWLTLGTALLFQFVSVTHAYDDLEKASKAFSKGVQLEAVAVEAATAAGSKPRRLPDLHYGRGQALQLLEEYPEAVSSFLTASRIDPSLPVEDTIDSMRKVAVKTAEMIAKKGMQRAKKVQDMAASVAGPAPAGSAEAKAVGERSAGRVSTLTQGPNTGTYLRLKVIGIVDRQEPLPG